MSDRFDEEQRFSLDDDVPVSLDSVVSQWRALVIIDEPWCAMPRDDVDGWMQRIIADLLELARDPEQPSRRHRLVLASRRHGFFRRQQRCSMQTLSSEFTRLDVALRAAVRATGCSRAFGDDTMTALQSDLALCLLAANRGFEDDTYRYQNWGA